MQIHELHLLAMARQPAAQQAAITERDRPGQLQQLADEGQPLLNAVGAAPRLKAADLRQGADRTIAVAHGAEVPHRAELLRLQGKRQGHPEATGAGVLHRLTVVVGKQNLGGHGDQESLHRL